MTRRSVPVRVRCFTLALLALTLIPPVAAQQSAQERTLEPLPRVGTAFVVAPNLLVTAHHALETHEQLYISTERDGLFTVARLVAFDEALDIALIEAAVDAPPVVFAPWESVPIGLDVTVVGFPKIGEVVTGKRITEGIINGEQRFNARNDWFQLSAEVHRGNSGSPVLAPDGTVVGIISHKLDARRASEMTRDFPQNVNFAMKSSRITDFLDAEGVDYRISMFDDTQSLRPYELYRDVTDAVHLLVVTQRVGAETNIPSP
ncbi:serine protease [Gammaproteobacteria bacterium 2W06]|nr:serine protease [Gammaproteobacteria bacterium 2W06]